MKWQSLFAFYYFCTAFRMAQDFHHFHHLHSSLLSWVAPCFHSLSTFKYQSHAVHQEILLALYLKCYNHFPSSPCSHLGPSVCLTWITAETVSLIYLQPCPYSPKTTRVVLINCKSYLVTSLIKTFQWLCFSSKIKVKSLNGPQAPRFGCLLAFWLHLLLSPT